MSGVKFFKLFACCFIVKGATRAAIYDLQRGVFETIPLSLADLLNNHTNVSYNELISLYNCDDKRIIDSYFNFLLKNEYGFWCNSKSEAERFPEMKTKWDIPFVISNAIIDFDSESCYSIDNAVEKIIKLGVPNIQFRLYSPFPVSFLYKLMSLFKDSRVKTIEILTQYDEGYESFEESISDLCKKHVRLSNLIFFNSPETTSFNLIDGLTKIQMTTQKMFSDLGCGNIHTNLFRINKNMFLEAKNFNTCLNKKLGIDRYGNVKNCPSMKQTYGKIGEIDLCKTVETDSFKSCWNLSKDKIDTCKDCEFRYMCVDCRVHLKDNKNFYSKPLNCFYDPYICGWKGAKSTLIN